MGRGHYGAAFYANVCRLLATVHGGVKHRRASVRLPLTKVGLELAAILRTLGAVDGYSVGQRAARVVGHQRVWDPTPAQAAAALRSSAEAAGYPAMALTLRLAWDRHAPLYGGAGEGALAALGPPPRAPAAALGGLEEGGGGGGGGGDGGGGGGGDDDADGSGSGSGSGSSFAISSTDADPQRRAVVRDRGFSHPMGLNAAVLERVKLISKPSAQRRMGVRALLDARRAAPPGVFLLSTSHGLMTDVDAELRNVGGVVLAHLGLPLGRVAQLRGLLRQKHAQEQAAAAAAVAEGREPPRPAPLAQWDARRAAADAVVARLPPGASQQAALDYLLAVENGDAPRRAAAASAAAGERLQKLSLVGQAWARYGGRDEPPALSPRSERGGGGGGGGGDEVGDRGRFFERSGRRGGGERGGRERGGRDRSERGSGGREQRT